MRLRLLLVISSVIPLVGCDHATKYWAESQLQGADPISILPNVLDLTYTRNFDVAFNALRHVPENWRFWLIMFAGLAAIGLIGLALFKRRLVLMEATAYALVLAGAIGNLADRAVRGYVVDFIHLHYWPVFNVADAWIVLGIGVLALSNFYSRPGAQRLPSQAPG